MAARAVVLDLDGTLWDSAPWYAAGLHELAGLDLDDVCLQLRRGGNVVRLADEHGVRSAFFRWCIRHCAELHLYEGAAEALHVLTERGAALGVVTNLSRKVAEPALRAHELFDLLDVAHYAAKKPSPTGLHATLEQIDQAPGEAIFVGDTAADAKAAQRAGVPFAWAAYGYGEQPELSCHAILQHPAEIALL